MEQCNNVAMILVAILSFMASIFVKFLVEKFLTEHVAILGSVVGLQRAENPGIAFGIVLPAAAQTTAIIGALALLLVLAFRARRMPLLQVGFGMILGGALGNLLDRAVDGLVTDYIQIWRYPLFNLPDTFIVLGVSCILLGEFLQKFTGKFRWKR